MRGGGQGRPLGGAAVDEPRSSRRCRRASAAARAGAVVKTLVPKLVAALARALHSGSAAKSSGAAGDVAGAQPDVLHVDAAWASAPTFGRASAADARRDAARRRASSRRRWSACRREREAGHQEKGGDVFGEPRRYRGRRVSGESPTRCTRCVASSPRRRLGRRRSATRSQRPHAQLLGAIAHAAGSRFGAHAPRVCPASSRASAPAKEEGSSLRAACLRAASGSRAACPRASARRCPRWSPRAGGSCRTSLCTARSGGDDDHVDLDELSHMDADEHMDDDDDGSSAARPRRFAHGRVSRLERRRRRVAAKMQTRRRARVARGERARRSRWRERF